MLSGYRLDFRSSQDIDRNYTLELEKLSESASINITVHESPLQRADLLSEMCKAKGLVHYASADANPRVVYEAILAGLPVFVTKQSNLPLKVQQQPFVYLTNQYTATNQTILKLNEDFARFMRFVQTAKEDKLQRDIDEFIRTALTEEASYNGICIKMRICWDEIEEEAKAACSKTVEDLDTVSYRDGNEQGPETIDNRKEHDKAPLHEFSDDEEDTALLFNLEADIAAFYRERVQYTAKGSHSSNTLCVLLALLCVYLLWRLHWTQKQLQYYTRKASF